MHFDSGLIWNIAYAVVAVYALIYWVIPITIFLGMGLIAVGAGLIGLMVEKAEERKKLLGRKK